VTTTVFAPLSIPSPDLSWQVFNLGQWLRDLGLGWVDWNLYIHMYAICILLGIFAAGIVTNRRLVRRGAEPWVVLDIALWAVIFGIVGARIFHVLTHPDDYFYAGADLMRTLYVWEGGIAIFGALLGGAVGAFIGCRLTGVRFWSFADALAPAMLLAQAFGRFGNWFNHELFGLPTDLPWGLEIESTNAAFPAGLPEGTLFHPTFLYEVIWNLLGVAILLFLERKFRLGRADIAGASVPALVPGAYRLQWGRLFGAYLVWYGIGRTLWESIRIDPSEIFLGLRTNVWAAVLAIVVGIIIIVVQGRRHPGGEPGVYVPGRQWHDPAAVDSEDTYSDSDFDDEVVVAASPVAGPEKTSAKNAATSGPSAKS
jgi:prolipoprotein diacylglyceryl transferase